MVRAFVEHQLEKGCTSQDVIVAKCLSITLVSTLSYRARDIALTVGYTSNEYLQYRYIELTINSHTADFYNIRATITLKSVKGYKDILNENFVRFIRPLDDIECLYIYPITQLLVYSLRNGLVYGTTLLVVLNRAFARADRRIKQIQPSFPILAAFRRGLSRYDLPKPAAIEQLLTTIKEIGLILNILSRIYIYTIRLGAIRDIAYLLRSNESFGYTTDEYCQILIHKLTSFNKGVTKRYVRDTTQDLYNARVANRSKNYRLQLRFISTSAVDIVRASITK